jgi:hypothetical protein
MAANTSLPNFLLELGEWRQMFEVWRSKRTLLYNAAAGHLNYKFGWAPFIGDVRRMGSLLDSFYRRYDDLQRGMLIPHKRYYRTKVPRTLPDQVDWEGLPHRGSTQYTYAIAPVYTLSVTYVYSIPDAPLNLVKGLLDSLGVRLNPYIVWEAIPYSFVVDWFFRVGDTLNALSPDNMSIDTVILDACHSLKYEVVSTASWGLNGVAPVPVWERKFRTYVRTICDPLSAVGVVSSLPGWQQDFLSLSLLITRGNGSWSRKTKALFWRLAKRAVRGAIRLDRNVMRAIRKKVSTKRRRRR